mmetsp:Transcript_45453/g.147702  ORF Transcript_45453/g.147702 Transcript_45453/m.147702 type:complete len:161 (-) Transcript_45453:20-502(-)
MTGPLCAGAVRSQQKCVSVSNVCFEAEQIILHGVDGSAFDRLNGLLNRTRDPSDAFSRLHPAHRPTVLLARPGDAFEYLPLAVGVKRSLRKRRHDTTPSRTHARMHTNTTRTHHTNTHTHAHRCAQPTSSVSQCAPPQQLRLHWRHRLRIMNARRSERAG